MTLTTRTPLPKLPRGHEFSPAVFTMTPAAVDAYTAAIGDMNAYGAAVPPLAAIALGLAALQEQIALPEGSLHTGQEVEHLAAVRVDEPLTLSGRVAQRSERQGYVISVLEFEIAREGKTALRARTTIMAPAS